MKDKVSQIIQVIGNWLKENWYLVILLIVAFCLRMWYPITGSFAFIFDQGKDSLNAAEMIVTSKPKLIGPWTSIPGLYFGPAWYYFLALCLWWGNMSPVAPVWGMILLGLVQVYLVYRYFGKVAATMVAAGSLWLVTTTSAWNPYPLTLVSWGIMILLLLSIREKRLTWQQALATGLLAGLGFHFSSAYAIFYPIIILICWWINRLIKNYKVILWAILGGLIAFAPQLLFELRHQGSEIQAVVTYFTGGGEASDAGWSWARMEEVWKKAEGEIRLAVLPDIKLPQVEATEWALKLVLVVAALIFAWWIADIYLKKQKLPQLWPECLFFIFVPLFGFSFLHFNIWYLLGMMPAVVILTAGVIESRPAWCRWLWMSLLIASGVSLNCQRFIWQDYRKVDTFYAPIALAWSEVKRMSYGKNFKVYFYREDIYDYNWQYLIWRDAWTNGEPLPVDFAYQPHEKAYVPMKEALVAGLPKQEGMEEYVFYVLDHPNREMPYWQEWVARNPGFAKAEYVKTIGEDIQIWRGDRYYEMTIQAGNQEAE